MPPWPGVIREGSPPRVCSLALHPPLPAPLTTLHPDVHQALLALKTLGRHPDGSAVIVAQSVSQCNAWPGPHPNWSINQNLQILSSVIAAKQDPDASNTAQRCVANALLLQDSGRDAWLALGGGEKALLTLQVTFYLIVPRIVYTYIVRSG
jgi:Guanine nucleotide exchange factor synembryn